MAIREYIVKITDEVIPDGFERFENEYAPEGEMVRCKDCKNACIYDDDEVICTHIDSNGNDKHPADWYCTDGRKKDEKD